MSKHHHVGAQPASLPSPLQEGSLFLRLLEALGPAPPTPQTPCLLTAGRAPSTRPTSLHRYFLRKTYHLRLDRSADYAEAAAAPAHNPPQASTSLSLPFLPLFFSLSDSQFLFFTLSLHLSIRFRLSSPLPFPPLTYRLRTETRNKQTAENNFKYKYILSKLFL